MKHQPFKLQPVLRHRELLEERARQELAAALHKEQELERSLKTVKDQIAVMQSELQNRQKRGISVQDLLLFEEGISRSGRMRSTLAGDLERARTTVQRCRDALARTSQDRRLLEKLKEKHQAQVRREAVRRETVMLDEVALQFSRERI